MQAALRLVDCVGQLDPPLSSLYLAFYQVCCTIRLLYSSLTHHTHRTELGRLCTDEGLPLEAAERPGFLCLGGSALSEGQTLGTHLL